VVAINPARPNNATDKITRVIRTSRRVKPFDCIEALMVDPRIRETALGNEQRLNFTGSSIAMQRLQFRNPIREGFCKCCATCQQSCNLLKQFMFSKDKSVETKGKCQFLSNRVHPFSQSSAGISSQAGEMKGLLLILICIEERSKLPEIVHKFATRISLLP
jgi:hypothetical protein